MLLRWFPAGGNSRLGAPAQTTHPSDIVFSSLDIRATGRMNVKELQQFSQFLTVKLCQVSRQSRWLNPAHAYTAHLRLSLGLSPTPPCPVCWLLSFSLFFFQRAIFKIVVQLLYCLVLDSVLTAAGEPHEGEARLQMSQLIKLMVHGLKNRTFIRALDIAADLGKKMNKERN